MAGYKPAMDVFIEATRKVTLPVRSDNGSLHRLVLWPPSEVPDSLPFNRVDKAIYDRWRKDRRIQGLFEDRTLRKISDKEAQDYADGSEPLPEDPALELPAQAQAEALGKQAPVAASAFPAPVRGKSASSV